jgi:ESCRT-I complex subunit VPS28
MASLTMSMDEEVRLYTNNADRERYNLLATLFGITVALDYLERAFVRDSITAAEYVPYLPQIIKPHSAKTPHRRDTRQHAHGLSRSIRPC